MDSNSISAAVLSGVIDLPPLRRAGPPSPSLGGLSPATVPCLMLPQQTNALPECDIMAMMINQHPQKLKG
jgi:hypothetical protein